MKLINENNIIKILAFDIYIDSRNKLGLQCEKCGSYESTFEKNISETNLLVKCEKCGFKRKFPIHYDSNGNKYIRVIG